MLYVSTRHTSPEATLKDAIMHSDAPDGGLYMPKSLPRFPRAVFNNISEMSVKEISYFVANSLFNSDLPSSEIKRIGDETFSFPIPLVKIEENIYALELFHGPTKVVKDIGARFLPRMLDALNPDLSAPLNVLVATNGHSGNAVANGFHGVRGVNVFALYPKSTPKERVRNLASLGGNVFAVRVNGTIDDCRRIVAETLADHKLDEGEMRFTCANSANIGRVLPQIICHFYAYAQLISQCPAATNICYSVPCGNAGDLLAGLMAKRMGLPVERLIAACNANGGFKRFLDGETAKAPASAKTLAYAMDTCSPANAPRFVDMCAGNLDALRREVAASACDDETIKAVIKDVYARTQYVLDPHSAAAYHALKQHMPQGATGVFFATASPSRSAQLVKDLIGVDLEPIDKAKRFKSENLRETLLPPTSPALKKLILRSVSAQ